jgi:hypothetical protein
MALTDLTVLGCWDLLPTGCLLAAQEHLLALDVTTATQIPEGLVVLMDLK